MAEYVEVICRDVCVSLPQGHTNIILASFENPASISPYRMNTTYRRPTNAESDLGYSTMTPQDDSEQASTTCIEPLILSRDRYRPPPSVSSKSSGVGILPPPPPSGGGSHRKSRSPSPPPISAQTRLLLGKESAIPEMTDILSASSLVPEQTVLRTTNVTSPNQVIANVQVHMVDTH